MALAQFNLVKRVGTSPGNESNTSWNPCLLGSDVVSTDTGSYPIPAPDTGYSYSYESWLRLDCTTAPDNGTGNFKVWFSANDPDTGVELFIGTTATYATPVSTASSVATTDATTYSSSGAAMTLGTPQTDDEITTTSHFSDYFVLQLRIDTTAGQGDMPTQVLHIRYDEW